MTRGARNVTWSIGLALGLWLAPALASAQTIRCPSGIVTRGDTTTRVQQACGFPTEQGSETVVEAHEQRLGDGQSITTYVTRTLVLWTFDFGARRLRQQLVIENGIVTAIRELGRGVGRPVRIDLAE